MKNFTFHQHLPQVLAAVIALLIFSDINQECHAIRLHPNGGYDIVIGVENNVMEPMKVQNFLEDIRLGVQQFSTELWKATNRRFFINSVDVIVPGNWWTLSNFDTATWQTLHGSEMRISHDVAAPNAVNPNTCGTPGLYVELPDTFFKVPRGGQFGAIGKALVNLWARYRFGVWEEHGIPGDAKFPYFYTYPSFEPKWEATGCSNDDLSGTFRTIDGDESERCDPYGSDSPDDDCRFVPSHSNTANSSLLAMHYWLDSVTQFCDSKTHNHAAPNRHNLLCGHRSSWEVIRESVDYKSTTSCTESVAPTQFRVLKESRIPEFYILLDRGRTVTPEKVLQEVMGALVQLVSYPTLNRVNIAVGTYPHSNKGRNHFYVKEEVEWAPILDVIYDIERVLNDSTVPDGPVIRDHGLAITEVTEKIKQRNHLAGTVVLVVKRGASPNLFDKISFEQEVIANIKEDSRIQVFAIETQQGDLTPYTNLQTLVETTRGQYHLINDTMNIAKKLEPMLETMLEKLEQSSIMNSISTWTIQKQYTEPDTSIDIPIYDTANMVKVHLTTHQDIVASDIYLEQLVGEHATMQESVKVEWDENMDLSRRIVFTYTIINPTPGSVWSLKHGCHTEKRGECRFFLVVTVNNDKPTPRLDEMIFNSQSITIDVTTSAAENNYVDMSDQGLRIAPLAIYAKIEMELQRVLNLENVTALVRLGGEHDNHLGDWIVPLYDNGLGLPDIAEHDGIYSGIFTPPENGLYQISVSASGESLPDGSSAFQNIRIVNHAGTLIQIDQLSFGCKNSSKPRCASAVPRGSFSRVQDMKQTVFVENAGTFKPGKPTRIMDFTVTAFPNFKLEFEFTSPPLLGSDDDPEEFRVYMAPHVDNFIGSTEMTQLIITEAGKPSGTRVKIPYNAAIKAIPFYAVEATYKGQKGGPSNVVGIVPSELGPIVPSPTTTPSPSSSIVPSSSGPTTTTEYPWPSTTPTTASPYPTTTEESEEEDSEESTTVVPSTTTDESDISSTIPSTTVSPTTQAPTSTTDVSEITGSSSSTTTAPTTEVTPTSTLIPTSDITGPVSSTTETPSSTTENGGVTTTGSPTTETPTSTTDNGDVTSTTSSTTETPTSTTDNGSSTSTITPTTETPTSTTENGGSTSSTTSPTTETPTSSTDNGGSTSTTSSTTETPTSTTDNGSSTSTTSSTTETPTSTTDNGSSTSTTSPTTETPTSTTDNGGSTSTTSPTTETPTSTTENGGSTSTTSPTTETPTSTTENGGSTSTTSPTTETPTSPTTETPTSTTENGGSTSTTSSTTETPTTTTENGGSTSTTSSTTETPTTTTENGGSTSTTSPTTEISTSTTENGGSTSTSSPTTEISTSTTESGGISSTTQVPSSTTENIPSTTSIASTTTEQVTTSIPSSTTSTVTPTASTPDEDVTVVPPSTTPEPTSSSLSTSEQANTPSTPITEPSLSTSVKVSSSVALLSIITLSVIYLQLLL